MLYSAMQRASYLRYRFGELIAIQFPARAINVMAARIAYLLKRTLSFLRKKGPSGMITDRVTENRVAQHGLDYQLHSAAARPSLIRFRQFADAAKSNVRPLTFPMLPSA
jgi:hypothetical protein